MTTIKYTVTTIKKNYNYNFNEKLAKKYNFDLKADVKEKKEILALLHKCNIKDIDVKIYKDRKDVTSCYL